MLIACYAYEGMYQGLHGIEDKCVIEVKDIEDAHRQLYEWGSAASEDLIFSYGLEDEYCEDEEDVYESNYYYDRGWYGYVIKDGIFASEREADAELSHHDFDSFVKMYCDTNIEL